jgi:hypothetical protein
MIVEFMVQAMTETTEDIIKKYSNYDDIWTDISNPKKK